jgi:cobalt-zinc-cadmium efflux system membrane fusion protein
MTHTFSRRLPGPSFALCSILALGLLPGGCNDRSAPNTSSDTHEEHGDHEGHDHGKHHDDHEGHDHSRHSDHEQHSDGHENHDGHDDHGSALRIGSAEQREFGIEIDTARPASLTLDITLAGELALNPDKVAHVAPRVAGVTHSVHKSIGDSVEKGELLAILDSRELAQAKARYLAASAKEQIANVNFAREDKLWKDKISAERTFLDARQDVDEARIARTLAERELHALGLSEEDVKTLPTQPEIEYTRYQLAAPIAGTVIARHLVRGEVVHEDADEPTFVIADLTSVWLNLTVHTAQLDHVRAGQSLQVSLAHRSEPLAATIEYVTPMVDASTRTATARAVLANPDGSLRPGLFVTATLASNTIDAPICVPNSAIQMIEGKATVFVHGHEGFTPVAVGLGASNETHTEIRSGLKLGDSYVARGAFVLKSEMQKSQLEHAGHAH